ncbi:MAG: S9 family peptidase [Acidobacteria bacterium]|nr:S9 family peptidase [Acidobacteriota bacterium]
MHRRLCVRSILSALAVFSLARPVAAQLKPLTLDAIYHPDTRVDFSGTTPSLQWLNDREYAWPRTSGGRTEWLKVDAASGRTQPLFDQGRLEAALRKLPGVSAEEAKRLASASSSVFNTAKTAILLTIAADLYYYELGAESVERLTWSPAEEEEASFSPDGRLVAFVRDNNLYLIDLPAKAGSHVRERAVTTDGSPTILNGKLDWVYQEEIYGRGNYRGYWWSPDSSSIAMLRLDEADVPSFTVVDHVPYHLDLEQYPYPKAGDPNPRVKLAVASVAGGLPRWIDMSRYATDFLIVNVGWTPDSRQVVFNVQNREQTWLDLNLADARPGESRRVLRSTTKAWVERPEEAPTWLADGTFLWTSESSGWMHLYRYRPDGTLVKQITTGAWEMRTLHGIDEKNGWIYFAATERSPIGLDVYRIRLDGSGMQRLTSASGTHRADFNPGFSHFIDAWSDVSTPPQLRLHRADGQEVRVIEPNAVPALAEYRLGKPEFLQVKARDGFVMEAMMIKPPDFDPTRRYPVYQHTYGGPHAPQVRNAWGGTAYLFHQLLAQKGIIVWIVDNRTASGKGAESVWPVYRRFGESELRDIEDGIAWLKQQPYVDGSRIGINGWSYGGFLVSYALTHSKSFVMGIAGGSVTDWRDYDTIYTERYMDLPQNNPEGYKTTAPRTAAANLHGRLLLLHGTMDDNVHLQNTMQFVHELQKAGKSFELMVYPKSRHGITDPHLVHHLRSTMLAFIEKTLLTGAGGAGKAGGAGRESWLPPLGGRERHGASAAGREGG